MNAMSLKNFFLFVGVTATGLSAAFLGHRLGLIVCVLTMIVAALAENKLLFIQNQKPLIAAQPAYDLIFRNMPCVAKVISPDLNLLMINKETTKLTGIKIEQVLGKKCYDVFGPHSPCPGCPVLEVIKTKRLCSVKEQERLFNTQKLCINQTAMPIFNSDGSIQYILEMSVDITQQKMLEKANHDLFVDTISSLSQLIDSRDHSTGMHSKRVRDIAVTIGRQMHLSDKELKHLAVSAILHDIGKIGIPEHILRKTGKLSPEEYAVIKRHADIGYETLKNIRKLDDIAKFVRHHHEAMDGSGYPCHLKGEEIPLLSRILSVADVYEALTANRIYRAAMSQEQALTIMQADCGTKFDPAILNAFFVCIRKGVIPSTAPAPLEATQAAS